MKDKFGIVINKEDIEIKYTEDNIINITGMIGSGKTTKANKYRNNENYIVISLDCLYRGQDKENINEETILINQMLQEKFPDKNEEQYFKEYYYEILNWISKTNRKITWVLEGQHIYRFLKLQDIKGKLIVKRTSLINCWIRSIVRHIKKGRIELRGNQITKKQYCANCWYWIKRRTKQLKYARFLINL